MDRHRTSWQTLRLVTLSLAFSMVVHCGNSLRSKGTIATDHLVGKAGVSLAFTTVVQGAFPGGKDPMPFLRLIRTDGQRVALASRISLLDRPALEAVDLSTNVVIAAFQGLKPTSGYRIDILAVEASGKVLNVTVKCSSPAPGELVRQGFECPYHLVQVAREAFDAHAFASRRLRDASGNVLEEGPIDGC